MNFADGALPQNYHQRGNLSARSRPFYVGHGGWGRPGPSPVPVVPTSRPVATHGRGASEAILAGVGDGKLALPEVGVMLASGLQFVAPGEESVEGTQPQPATGTGTRAEGEGMRRTGRPARLF